VMLGDVIVNPQRLGIDVISPAAMGGLAVGLIAGRREIVAACSGAAVAVAASLLISSTIGIIAGGLVGPLVGLLVPPPAGGAVDPSGEPLPRLEDMSP